MITQRELFDWSWSDKHQSVDMCHRMHILGEVRIIMPCFGLV